MRAVEGGTDSAGRKQRTFPPHIAPQRLPGAMSDAEEDGDGPVDDADDVDEVDTDALSDAFARALPRLLTCRDVCRL